MDINVNSIVFEGKNKDLKGQFTELDSDRKELLVEFLESVYFDSGLDIAKFLDSDKTIDLERLELAISLLIEYLEFLDKLKEPIYIFIKNIGGYFKARGIHPYDFERITEEATFILGFCKAIAENIVDEKEVVVMYAR